MDVSGSFSGDELIPDSCLESEWIDEDEVFAILKQWETRGGRGYSKAAATSGWCNPGSGSHHILLNQSFSSENSSPGSSNISGKLESLSTAQQVSECVTECIKKESLLDDIDSIEHAKRLLNPNSSSQRFVDTGTFTRPKKRIDYNALNNASTLSVESNPSSTSHNELASGGSPLLNVQIGGPVTPSSLATSALATSATANRLLMQRSWLNDVSPPCSIMNSMEFSANERIANSLITSGDFSSVGCLLNASDENVGLSVGNNASFNGYNLYSVIEDRQRLENLCLDEESTLTKDCNISRTDLNAIENVSGVSTMQNSYESSGRTTILVGSSGKSSFEDESASPPITAGAQTEGEVRPGLINTTLTAAIPANETFHVPTEISETEAERILTSKLLMNGGGTYDMRRPRNFNTYRKPRSSFNQTFDGLPRVDTDGPCEGDRDSTIVPTIDEQTFDGQIPIAVQDKHAVMNSTFGIVGEEKLGGVANGHGTFVRNCTVSNDDDVRLLNLTQDMVEPAEAITPPPAVPFDRTFKRRPRNGTFTGGEDDMRHLPLESPLRPTVVGHDEGNVSTQPESTAKPREQRTPNGTFSELQQLQGSSMLVQSTPFHGPSARVKTAPEIEDLSPIGPENTQRTPTSGFGRTMVRRSRNLEQDLRNASYEDTKPVPAHGDGAGEMLDLETDDFDVQIRRLPSAATTHGTDISNFLDAEKRISLQHFEEFEKSILESEHSGIDFDEMLNSLTADVRRPDEAGDKLRQSLDNIKKRHSRINLEKQQQDEMKRKLHQQQPATLGEAQCDNKLADSMLSKSGSMCSSTGSERLLNRRSRYNEDVHLTLSPQQQSSPSMNATVVLANGENEGLAESSDPASTANEVETYDRKNRDRFKTIRLGRKRDDSLGAAVPDVDQELGIVQPMLNGAEEDSINGSGGTGSGSSAFSRLDHNSLKTASASSYANGGRLLGSNNLPSMKTEPSGDDDEAVFKKPQAIPQQPSGLARPGESRLRSTLSKPRYYGNPPVQGIGGIQRKDLTLPLGSKSSSTDCLEQREQEQYLHQQQKLPLEKSLQQPTSRLAMTSKLGGGSGGLLGTGRYSQFGLGNKQLQLQQQQLQTNAMPHQPGAPPTLKSPMGTKSKSYHSLTFAQANNSSGYGGSSGNLSKLHGTSALQLKLKHNSSNTELKSNTSKRSSLQQQAASNLRNASNGYQQGAGAGAGMVGRASLPLVRSPAAQPNAARTSLNNSSTAAAMANKTALNTTTTLSGGGVQMRTASGMAKTSRLGLIRPSSGYFSYNTHRKHPDSDNESVNSLSSSSASSRGSLYRVDSQSIANNVQPQQYTSATRTNSIEDVSGASSGGVGNGLLTKLNGTGAGMGPGVLSAYASIEPPLPKTGPSSIAATGLKQPVATSGAKPSGLRPPSAIRPTTVRSGLPRPTSYIRR
uniref:Uncharacterized protein n=1 Tax=Anopheles minimus TaxID=112268 RepID=A0A182WB13_9DIPT